MAFVDASKMREHALRMAEEETALEEALTQLVSREQTIKRSLKQDEHTLQTQEHELGLANKALNAKIGEFEELRRQLSDVLLAHKADVEVFYSEFDNVSSLQNSAAETLQTCDLLEKDALSIQQKISADVHEITAALDGISALKEHYLALLPAKMQAVNEFETDTKQLEKLRDDIECEEQTVYGLRDALSQLQLQIAQREEELRSLDTTIGDVEQSVHQASGDLQSLQDELHTLQESSAAEDRQCQIRLGELDQSITADGALLATLQQENEMLQAACTELATKQSNMELLRLNKERRYNSFMSEAVAVFELADGADVDVGRDILTGRLHEMEAGVQRIKSLAADKQDHVCRLERTVKHLGDTNLTLLSDIKSKEAELHSTQQDVTHITAQLSSQSSSYCESLDAIKVILTDTRISSFSLTETCEGISAEDVRLACQSIFEYCSDQCSPIIRLLEGKDDARTWLVTIAENSSPSPSRKADREDVLEKLRSAGHELGTILLEAQTEAERAASLLDELLASVEENDRLHEASQEFASLQMRKLELEQSISSLQIRIRECESSTDVQRAEWEAKLTDEYLAISKDFLMVRNKLSEQIEAVKSRIHQARSASAGPPLPPTLPSKEKPVHAPAPKATVPPKASKATAAGIFDLAGFEDDGIVFGKQPPPTRSRAAGRGGRSNLSARK